MCESCPMNWERIIFECLFDNLYFIENYLAMIAVLLEEWC